jgi:DNA topoisomerase-1
MTLLEKLRKTGIRRLGSPASGFHYMTAEGRRPGAAHLERIDALRIPPAWTDVRISPSPRASLQAVGKDRAGRWQYLYHEAQVRRRERRRHRKLLHFADALPRLRRAIDRDLRRRGLERERVMACILRILSTVFMRPGSQVYASENGSYGLATLRRRHVTVQGDLVRFDFPGKSGKRQQREVRDRRVARMIRKLMELRSGDLFQFESGNGELVDVRRKHINAYIKEVMGEDFSAKDFRTWAGTLICACALARAGEAVPESKAARKREVVAALKETAESLGNTPAICRSSYVAPALLDAYDRGRVIERHFEDVEEIIHRRRGTLHRSEKALLELLRRAASP